MRKIKYQGGLTKLVASALGKRNKLRFARFVEQNLTSLNLHFNEETVPIDIVSFSSGSDFYEQVLSILSFKRYIGTPELWTVYSDGSHSTSQIDFLKKSFQFVKVEKVIFDESNNLLFTNCKDALLPYKSDLLAYARKHPLGKRLFLYLNYEIKRPTIFLDSDILFYNQASNLHIILKEKVNGWFLPDEVWGCLDSRYEKILNRQLYQVNGGFIVLNKNLSNLSEGLNFLKKLGNEYEYFSEQTIMHIILKDNEFMPLDPRIFILNSGDQFDFSYLFPGNKMALRHYTGPVRHKMWQRDWKWHLSLS